MLLRLREEHKIEFGEIDFNEKLTINGLVYYMQQLAANHAIKLGFSYYKNGENPKYYWVLSRVKFEIKKYPKWQDQIALETYPGGYDRLFGVRLFDLFNETGECIAHIIGYYILIDIETNRPVRMKGAQGALSILDFPYQGETLEKLPLPTQMIQEEIRKARYSEIDVNKHMNNACYVKWVVDMIALEDFETKEIGSLQLNYNTSITYNTEVKVHIGMNTPDEYLIYGTSIDGQINYFSAQVVMSNK